MQMDEFCLPWQVMNLKEAQYSQVVKHFQRHVLDAFPHEAVGAIDAAGQYVRLGMPLASWSFADLAYNDHTAILHSHVVGPNHPTETDMWGQMTMDRPWGLVVTDGETVSPVLWWGDCMDLHPPLLGREYRPGPTGSDGKGDCYAFIRDLYLRYSTHSLPDIPRDVDRAWVEKRSLYLDPDNYERSGMTLERYDPAKLQPGDVLIMQCGHGVAGHAAVYLGNEMIAHHWYNATSRLDPIHRYRNSVEWVMKPPKGTIFRLEAIE